MQSDKMGIRKNNVTPENVMKIIVICIALFAALMPLIYLVSNSIKPDLEMYNNSNLFPTRIETEHYAKILEASGGTLNALLNSIIVTLSTVFSSVILGALAAYALNKIGARKIVMVITTLIIVVRFYPKITVVIPYFVLMKDLGLLDTLFGIILAHVSITLPFVVMMMSTFFAETPKEIEESAFIDGAGVFRTFFSIVIPINMTGLASSAIITAMTSWNEFLMASSIASQKATTMPILISGFITDKGTDWGAMSAMSVICIIPIVVLVLLTQRFLVKGLTAGAVKG
jgi:ABC-type sugar transport system, permease component